MVTYDSDYLFKLFTSNSESFKDWSSYSSRTENKETFSTYITIVLSIQDVSNNR